MSKLNSLEKNRVLLKNAVDINEAMLQEYIFENPYVLWLWELTPLTRELQQPSGWRLDIYMWNDAWQRYEIEIQLWETDPSHIIRTIEYRDNERKRYPNYDHCAVIVAENITWRFMNVISLFNWHIPLIALKMSAFKNWSWYDIVFEKVLDRVTIWSEEEDILEITDRSYREKKSNKSMLELTDYIFNELNEFTKTYNIKYNKFYIWLTKEWKADNFISFKPKKKWVYINIKAEDTEENHELLDKADLEYDYIPGWWRRYFAIKLTNKKDFENKKEVLEELIRKYDNFEE